MPWTKAQLEALWIRNGGNPAKADEASAIALAESSGDEHVVNSIGATGLWQILKSAHPDWVRRGDLRDPNLNARAAIAISGNGTNWRPWTTYTGADTPRHERTYLHFLDRATRPASSVPGSTSNLPAAGTRSPSQDDSDLMDKITRGLVWIACVLGGAALFLMGVIRIGGIPVPGSVLK